jgi:aminopeptidase N
VYDIEVGGISLVTNYRDFFTSEMTATVEAQHKVISNGKLLSDKKNADGTHTVSWKMEQPHAPYLVSLVVGEYALIEEKYAGIPVQSYVYPNEVAEGKNTTQRLAAMVKFSRKRPA